MKIIEIITEEEAQPVAAPITATPAGPSKKYQSLDTLNKDPDALVTTWAPRLDQLTARANSMMVRLIKAAGPKYARQLAGTTLVVRSTENYANATVDQRLVTLDITVFWDAPDATLAVAIGHELGHIALGHTGTAPTPLQSRKDEFSADDFGIRLAKSLGYNTAELFKFMHDKEEYDRLNFLGNMDNSTHPPYNQRIDRAKKSGFKLSKGGQQQIDALQQHLA